MMRDFPLNDLLSFKSIINDFISKSDSIKDHVDNFLSDSNIENKIETKFLSASIRTTLSEVLRYQYEGVDVNNKVSASINLLRDSRTFTVTTGHQLNILTGPLFFLVKISQTIKLAEDLKVRFPGYNFVPVYWMATEDHDLEEIDHLNLFGNKKKWDTNQTGAVGRFNTVGMEAVMEELLISFERNEDAKSLLSFLKEDYLGSNSLSEATRRMVHHLFSEDGLVILDADDKSLKHLMSDVFISECENGLVQEELVKSQEILSQKGYHEQVHPREINLFYLEKNDRQRIVKGESGFSTFNENKYWTGDELNQEIKDSPENFSPNAVLRPVYQELILPNLVTIGGPGEISYWLQLKSLFERLKVDFPILVLRNSHLFISQKQEKLLAYFGLGIEELFLNKEQLIKKAASNRVSVDFTSEKESISEIKNEVLEKIKREDASLVAKAEGVFKALEKSFDQLEAKLAKGKKEKEESKFTQLGKLSDDLFPNGNLNERSMNFLELLNRKSISEIIQDLKISELNHSPKIFIHNS